MENATREKKCARVCFCSSVCMFTREPYKQINGRVFSFVCRCVRLSIETNVCVGRCGDLLFSEGKGLAANCSEL